MTQNWRSYCIALAIMLIAHACATISNPGGGPRDQTPPVLVESSIPNGTVNFDQRAITLTFNEYVQLKNASQDIFTSPPLEENVSFTARKNKIFITFKDSLIANTTYHLNFGNSIQDLNEGNPLNNFQFVFATGDFIDSISIL